MIYVKIVPLCINMGRHNKRWERIRFGILDHAFLNGRNSQGSRVTDFFPKDKDIC